MLRFNAISEKKKKEVVKENERFLDLVEGAFCHHYCHQNRQPCQIPSFIVWLKQLRKKLGKNL